MYPSTAFIYRGRGAGTPGRCVPEGKGSVIGRKRGVFGPPFGKPAEKTRPFEQTQKGHPRNFPPVPTSDSATQTERFRPVPLPPILENPGLPGPGIPGAFWRRLPGPNPGRDPPGSTGKTVCIFLTVCVLPTIKGAVPCICIPAERIYAYTHGGDFLRTSPHVSAPTKLDSKIQICQTDGVTIFSTNLNPT